LKEFGQENMSGSIGLDPEGNTVKVGGKLISCGIASNSMVSADFNLDGDLDIAVAEGESNQIQVYHGDGKGKFAEAFFLMAAEHPHSLVTGDFDKNGVSDLAVLTQDLCGVTLFLSKKPGECQAFPCKGVGGCQGQGGDGCECKCMCECKSLQDCAWVCAWVPDNADCQGAPVCAGIGDDGCECESKCVCTCSDEGSKTIQVSINGLCQ